MEQNKNYCTLTDSELADNAEQWIDKLIKSGGKDFIMCVPARPNEDTDLILAELHQRFLKYCYEKADLKAKGDNLARQARSARLSFTAHPDYTGEANDEWTNMVEGLDEAIAEWKGEKEPAPAVQQGAVWAKASERPLILKKDNGNWVCTDDGEKEFIAAVPYLDKRHPGKTFWWIRHCVIENGSLCVVGDDDNTPSGWEIDSVEYWMLWPSNPDESAGEKEGILKVGLKFRSKVAPLCLYEVVKIFPETKEFKVKETRECQVSGTTSHEVWSIEGFEKYYNLGVYYIQKEVKP